MVEAEAVSAVGSVGGGDAVRGGVGETSSDHGGGSVSGADGSGSTVDGGSLGLSSGDVVLGSGNAAPVRVLVDVPVSFSDLADCLSVVLDDGLRGAGLAFAERPDGVPDGDAGVDGGGLNVTSVGSVHVRG